MTLSQFELKNYNLIFYTIMNFLDILSYLVVKDLLVIYYNV